MAAFYPEERRSSNRYGLALPVRVVRISDEDVAAQGKTRDLSSAGAYLELSDGTVIEGSTIEFIVTLQDGILTDKKIPLRCQGRVTRAIRLGSDGGRVGVATTIDRYQFLRRPVPVSESAA